MNKRCCGVSNDSSLIWKQSEIFGQQRIEWSVFAGLLLANTCQWNQLSGRPTRAGERREDGKGPEKRAKSEKKIEGMWRNWEKWDKKMMVKVFSLIFWCQSSIQTTCYILTRRVSGVQVWLWRAGNGTANSGINTTIRGDNRVSTTCLYFPEALGEDERRAADVNASWVTVRPDPAHRTRTHTSARNSNNNDGEQLY